jgi:nucleoside 2-deoxyribosyltransferase
MKLYLCGPINGRSDDDCTVWREEVKSKWPDCLDPMARDFRGRELEPGIDEEIVEGDKEDIRQCDGLLVYFDKPSVGTSMEVFYAHSLGKRIVIIDKSDRPLSPWLTYHSHKVVRSISDALKEFA